MMIATEKFCIKNTPKSQAHICGVFLLFSAIHLVFSPIITLRVCDIRSASVWRPDGCFVQRLSPEPRRSTFRCVFRLHAAVLAQSSLKALATHLFVAKSERSGLVIRNRAPSRQHIWCTDKLSCIPYAVFVVGIFTLEPKTFYTVEKCQPQKCTTQTQMRLVYQKYCAIGAVQLK